MENKKKWEVTTNRFVAFFDIMGFKDFVLKNNHKEVLDKLKTLSRIIKGMSSNNNNISYELGETRSFTFSDSIFIFSKTDSIVDAKKIAIDCSFILKEAFKAQIPIKGCLSFGEITVDYDKSIFFGQPIIDAYLLHDDLNLYSVICDNNFERRLKEIDPEFLTDFFIWHKAALKSGKINHYLLGTLNDYRAESIENLKKLYNTVSGKPRQYIDNTIEFIEFQKRSEKI